MARRILGLGRTQSLRTLEKASLTDCAIPLRRGGGEAIGTAQAIGAAQPFRPTRTFRPARALARHEAIGTAEAIRPPKALRPARPGRPGKALARARTIGTAKAGTPIRAFPPLEAGQSAVGTIAAIGTTVSGTVFGTLGWARTASIRWAFRGPPWPLARPLPGALSRVPVAPGPGGAKATGGTRSWGAPA